MKGKLDRDLFMSQNEPERKTQMMGEMTNEYNRKPINFQQTL